MHVGMRVCGCVCDRTGKVSVCVSKPCVRACVRGCVFMYIHAHGKLALDTFFIWPVISIHDQALQAQREPDVKLHDRT